MGINAFTLQTSYSNYGWKWSNFEDHHHLHCHLFLVVEMLDDWSSQLRMSPYLGSGLTGTHFAKWKALREPRVALWLVDENRSGIEEQMRERSEEVLLDAGFERLKERSRRRIGRSDLHSHLDTPYWRPSMDQRLLQWIVSTTMASIQEALASFK
ncbi:hypothetical protein AAG906_033380 [Vitis piasezkii]